MKNLNLTLLFLLFSFLQKNIQAQPGTIDPTFNNGVIAFGNLNLPISGATNVGIQSDGKIISFLGTNTGSHIIRFKTDGTIDTSFGTLQIPFTAITIKIIDNDNFLLGGLNGTIQKFNADGIIDNSFENQDAIDMNIFGLSIQADGKILAAGNRQNTGTGFDYILARYEPDGSLDLTFGNEGETVVDIVNKDTPYEVYQLSDGSIIIQGSSLFGASLLGHLIKFKPDGSLDTSFANEGIFQLDLGIESYSNSSQELTDGKILIEGMFNDNGVSTVFLQRLNSDGTIDSTFGNNGNSADPTFQNGEGFTIPLVSNSAVLQPDGKVLTNGFTWGSLVGGDRGFGVKRYLADGTVDTDFGNNGLAFASILDVNIIDPWMALDPNGNIIQVAKIDKNGAHDIVVVRYLNDLDVGTLDFENQSNSFLVFPNPIIDYCELKFSIPSEKKITAYLTGVDGRIIHQFFTNQKFEEGEHQLSLDMPTLASGNYFITLVHDKIPFAVQVFKK